MEKVAQNIIKKYELDKTIVIFRKWKNGDIIAIFPESDTFPDCMIYERVGQHGNGDYYHVISQTTLALPNEYIELKKELESEPYKYNFIVRKKWSRK